MELRHLRYFVAVAEERGFTRAAQRLWIAQPGLSTQIRKLETELGVSLFERHTRGAELTAAGRLFLERARLVLQEADAGAPIVANQAETAVVRVGLCAAAPWPDILPTFAAFARMQPELRLATIESYGGTLWTQLRDRALDVVLGPAHLASPDLETMPLRAGAWAAIMDERHRLASRDTPLSLDDLDGEQIVITGLRDGVAYDRAVQHLLDEHGVSAELKVAPRGRRPFGAVAGGAAIALSTVPALLPRHVAYRVLTPRRELAFNALWQDRVPAPAVARFLARLSEAAPPMTTPPRQLLPQAA